MSADFHSVPTGVVGLLGLLPGLSATVEHADSTRIVKKKVSMAAPNLCVALRFFAGNCVAIRSVSFSLYGHSSRTLRVFGNFSRFGLCFGVAPSNLGASASR